MSFGFFREYMINVVRAAQLNLFANGIFFRSKAAHTEFSQLINTSFECAAYRGTHTFSKLFRELSLSLLIQF